MNSRILILLLCVLAFSPVADAFSLGDIVEFFEEVFGPADITGMVPGARCERDQDCRAGDEVCYSGSCVQLCENERNNAECLKLLQKKKVRDPETYFCSLRVPVGRGSRDLCLQPTCGNEKLEGREVCDDGNTDGGDGCGRLCLSVELGWTCNNERMPSKCSPVCGDGRIVGNEACDDGNTNSGDGCGSLCRIETGWSCSGTPSRCTEICGDGRVVGNEDCDDGNSVQTDACLNTCVDASCGDGHVRSGVEACDDGNSVQTDACLNTCASASCSDTHCYLGSEDSCGQDTFCLEDCGRCFEYDNPPAIDISGMISEISPGASNITINITNATSCFYNLFRLVVLNEGTRRQLTKLDKVRAGITFDSCDSREMSEEINTLMNGLYDESFDIGIGATNNAGSSSKSTGIFSFTGRTINVKGLPPGGVYSELKEPPIEVKVSETKKKCEYKLGSCNEYIDVTDTACSTSWSTLNPVADFDQSCFNDGPTPLTYKITNMDDTTEEISIKFVYIKSIGFFEKTLKRRTGIRMTRKTPEDLYPVVLAKETPDMERKAINISKNVTLALAASKLSLRNSKTISGDDWDRIFGAIKNKQIIKKELGALRAATFYNIKPGLVPAARINADAEDVSVQLYMSKILEGKTYTLTALNTHKVTVETDDTGDTKIVTITSDPVTIELGIGECKSVDINADSYEDVIVCYDEEFGVTIDNIVIVDEELESPIKEGTTIISPVTYSIVNEYEINVDRDALEKEILEKLPDRMQIEKEILKKYSPVLIIVTLMLLYVIFVASFSLENVIRKRHKKK